MRLSIRPRNVSLASEITKMTYYDTKYAAYVEVLRDIF